MQKKKINQCSRGWFEKISVGAWDFTLNALAHRARRDLFEGTSQSRVRQAGKKPFSLVVVINLSCLRYF